MRRDLIEVAERYADESWPEQATYLLAQHIEEAIKTWLRGYEADLARDEEI